MKQSHIQWTDATVNFWVGCQKVSTECKNCYFYRDYTRYGKNPTIIKRVSDNTFYAALKWKNSKKIFTCSWSDFFIQEADLWRQDAWNVIKDTPHHSWQILTKRPERILQNLPYSWDIGWDNVWLGVSAGTQTTATKNIPILLDIPSRVRFLSIEPLIEEVNISNFLSTKRIHWVIIGGESGNDNGKFNYRPCKIEWIAGIIEQCKKYNVKVFVKQLGTHLYKELKMSDRHGGLIEEFPLSLKLREFPNN